MTGYSIILDKYCAIWYNIGLMVEKQSSSLSSISFAYKSARSLLHNIPDRVGVLYRPIYEQNANSPEGLPLNTEEEILSSILSTIQDRQISSTLSFHPYWNPSISYNPLEVFGATIQSVDLHDAPLPNTVLPPAEDVEAFIKRIKALPHKAKIGEQFTVALDLTDDHLLGAVNLCWIATRVMGRGADQRAYPTIPMDGNAVRQWNDEVAQFETYNNSGQNDAPGDTYYFWTHAFGAMVFSEPGIKQYLGQKAFSKGTDIMAFVRKHIARKQPNITDHDPASELGRNIGLALASLAEHV